MRLIKGISRQDKLTRLGPSSTASSFTWAQPIKTEYSKTETIPGLFLDHDLDVPDLRQDLLLSLHQLVEALLVQVVQVADPLVQILEHVFDGSQVALAVFLGHLRQDVLVLVLRDRLDLVRISGRNT